ncbi:hypothetical protein [Brevundimonas sp. R86498]|uniref:hypothetical protein n=1 Tax=Brevundimonas sp. R86498 TaxID=3093845 RepID=UPI0037CC9FF2
MRVIRISALLLAGLVSACASGAPLDSGTVAGAAAAAPAPTPGYDWHFTPSEDSVYLAYGVENSDDLKIGLHCSPGSGQIELAAPAPTGSRVIHLESGGEMERFDAKGEPSELHGGDFLTAGAAAREPLFQRFRRLGWLAQWTDGRRETYAAHPGSESGVERFFARCG